MFVPECVLWFWDDAPIPGKNPTQVISASEISDHPITSKVEMANAFVLWAISKDTSRVILDDGSWFQSLTVDERLTARRMQVRLKRGHCVPADWVPRMQHESVDDRLVLEQAMWAAMTDDERVNVIRNQLIDWDEPYTLPVPDNLPAHIAEFANRFVLEEGINCIAVAGFAATEDRSLLITWPPIDMFLNAISEAGYRKVGDSRPIANDVIAFSKDDTIIHAAYSLGNDRFVNKNGQSSFNPVRIIDEATLMKEWPDTSISIYRRFDRGSSRVLDRSQIPGLAERSNTLISS